MFEQVPGAPVDYRRQTPGKITYHYKNRCLSLERLNKACVARRRILAALLGKFNLFRIFPFISVGDISVQLERSQHQGREKNQQFFHHRIFFNPQKSNKSGKNQRIFTIFGFFDRISLITNVMPKLIFGNILIVMHSFYLSAIFLII